MKETKVNAQSELGRRISDAREAAIQLWAASTGQETENVVALREKFYALPYEERRIWHVRPGSRMAPSPTPPEEPRLVEAYRRSGDAVNAYRTVGVELGVPWVEQKRNSRGVVEILTCDMPPPEAGTGDVLEAAEGEARREGMYDPAFADEPTPPDEEVEFVSPQQLLARAREAVSQQSLAVFLAVEVDGVSVRQVAREMGMSPRQVTQIVDQVKTVLRNLN